MTTVFEGTIDGVNYNNRADYNTALCAKIKEGKGYSASYSMHTVPDDDESRSVDEHACDCGGQGCKGTCKGTCQCKSADNSADNADNYVLPGFNSGRSFVDFLDSISSDYPTNKFIRDSFHDDLFRDFEIIMKCVDKCKDVDELNGYLDKIGGVMDNLSDAKDANSAAIHKAVSEYNDARSKLDELMADARECEDRMERSERSLNIMRTAAGEINHMEACYQDLSKHINGVIDKLADAEEDKGNRKGTVVETDKPLNDILTDTGKKELEQSYPSLYRLLSRIFS